MAAHNATGGTPFPCPTCGERANASVQDTRPVEDGIRRRRLCLSCGTRFSTFEQAHTFKKGPRVKKGASAKSDALEDARLLLRAAIEHAKRVEEAPS